MPALYRRLAVGRDMFHTGITMDDTIAFQNALAESLEKRRDWLDRSEMPRLKEEFRLLQSAFTGLHNILMKKGILHEDPYKNDAKMGDVQVPPEGPFSESEKIDQMSIRLSNYESQLDFLLNFYQFSADFLSMERIKKIVALAKYFMWTQMTANSPNINTRTLVELIALVKGGNDPLSIGLIADSLQHLEKASKTIFASLKEVSDYHRESYKLELRLQVMSFLKFDSATVITHKDDTIRQVKRKFAETMSNRPFYPELVDEVLKEDYSGEGPGLKEALLARLALKEDKPKEEKRSVSFKSTLMEGIRVLGSLNFTLDDALRKMDENSALLQSQKKGFLEKVRIVVRKMLNKPDDEIFYEVEYFDSATSTSKNERLNFSVFRQEAERKTRFLAALNNKTTSVSKKLEAANEDQVLAVLGKNIEEMQSIHKSLSSLDVFFKSEAAREERERMRGIKPELTGIKNGIIKANQKRHEYIAQKEELEQMKKLGIRTDVV